MFTLVSPSENKNEGGDKTPLKKEHLLFPQLFEKRRNIVDAYNKIMQNSSLEKIQKITGIKNEKSIKKYQIDIFSQSTMPAIQRYSGVAYEYLDISSLQKKEKEYLYKKTVIFSNLFGPILGGDLIPEYKFKQGSSIGDIKTEKIYKEEFSLALDTLLKDELILDLRADFYQKFYTLSQPFVTMKFIKNGKTVSHWAKAYRGVVLREIAKNQPKNKEELLQINYKNLNFTESIPYKKGGEMLIYEIV